MGVCSWVIHCSSSTMGNDTVLSGSQFHVGVQVIENSTNGYTTLFLSIGKSIAVKEAYCDRCIGKSLGMPVTFLDA